MNRKTLWLLAFLALTWSAKGQIVQILNEKTGEPISDVFIFHDKRSFTAFTNKKGEADISHFPNQGNVYFQHPSFSDWSVAMDSLAAEQFQLTLSEKLVWFNELVVAASKWEQEEKDLSQTVTTISRKEIAFSQPATSADLLSQSGQVFVQKSQLGGGSPKLRGFSANAVLLVVDGVRMNNAIFRSGNLQNIINIDPNALASSEVLFGPGSVIYGSDALGGVMDFHTIDPKWSSAGAQFEVNILSRYATAANERTSHVDAFVAGKRLVYFGSVTHTEMDDLRAGANRSKHYEGSFFRPNYVKRKDGVDVLVANENPNVQVGSGYDLFSTVQKVKALVTDNTEVTYGFYYSTTSDIPRYDQLVITQSPSTDALAFGEWSYGPQTWQMHSFHVSNYAKTAIYDELRVTTAFQQMEESRKDRPFGSDRLRIRTELVDVLSMNVDAEKETKKGSLFYGAEYTHNSVTSTAIRRNLTSGEVTSTGTRYPDEGSTFRTAAIYANKVHELNSKWTLNAGARYSHIQLNAAQSNDNETIVALDNIDLTNSAMNGMVGLVHFPTEQSKLAFTLSSGFRAPNVDDVGKVFEFSADENGQPILVVPNEKLRPEYAYNGELSYARIIKQLTFSIVGFCTVMTDPILRDRFTINGQSTLNVDDDNDPMTPDETYSLVAQVNGERAYIYGGSVQVKYAISEPVSTYATASFSDGRETATDQPLRHATPVFGKFGISRAGEKTRLDCYAEFNGNRWRSAIPDSEIVDKPYLYTPKGSPGWMTVNVKAQQVLTNALTVSAGLENIFDVHYRPYSSGISAPGRNFFLSLRGSF
jgi:hemoglobin/transferrin/lactoferrin receptor protein